MKFEGMTIAVDFDNTITHRSEPPITGKINKEVIEYLKELKKGNILILWTCRQGKELEEAVELCRKNGLEFDYVNQDVDGNICKKVRADVYIDDKAFSL